MAEGAEAHGTSVAKQYATMKNPEKTSNVAEAAEQELPGKSGVAARKEISPSATLIKALPDHQEAANALSSSDPHPSSVTASTGVPILSLPVTDLRVSALERTHDMVALHALRLSNSSTDSLHVVIKPGAGVQLSLELRQKGDGIEVQAQLHRGDMEFFRQHWTELQDRLEPRGVRLADLTSSDNFVGTNTGGFAQPQQQQSANEDPLFAGAFAEFAMADFKGAPAEQRAAQAAAYRGWETWA